MKNLDLIRELKGRVAGESREQVQVYLSVPPMVEDQIGESNAMVRESISMPYTISDLQLAKRTRNFAKKVAAGLHACPNLLEDVHKRAEAITHIVLAVDHINNYALIEKKQYHYEKCESCNTKHVLKEGNENARSSGFRDFTRNPPEYLLAGINDDDKLYFLHPLNRIPLRLIQAAIQEGDVQSIVNWANRADEGFNLRIQGDIIAKNLNVKRYTTHEEHIAFVSNVITGNVGQTLAAFVNDLTFDKAQCYYCQTEGGVIQVDDAIVTRTDNLDRSGSARDNQVDEVATPQNSKKEAHFVDLNNIKSNKLNSISIGNRHKLITDGHIERISRNGMRNVFCIVEASRLELEHPEHQRVVQKIGNGDSATASMLITIQRGSVNNGLDD